MYVVWNLFWFHKVKYRGVIIKKHVFSLSNKCFWILESLIWYNFQPYDIKSKIWYIFVFRIPTISVYYSHVVMAWTHICCQSTVVPIKQSQVAPGPYNVVLKQYLHFPVSCSWIQTMLTRGPACWVNFLLSFGWVHSQPIRLSTFSTRFWNISNAHSLLPKKSNSSALATELHIFCIKSLIWALTLRPLKHTTFEKVLSFNVCPGKIFFFLAHARKVCILCRGEMIRARKYF